LPNDSLQKEIPNAEYGIYRRNVEALFLQVAFQSLSSIFDLQGLSLFIMKHYFARIIKNMLNILSK